MLPHTQPLLALRSGSRLPEPQPPLIPSLKMLLMQGRPMNSALAGSKLYGLKSTQKSRRTAPQASEHHGSARLPGRWVNGSERGSDDNEPRVKVIIATTMMSDDRGLLCGPRASTTATYDALLVDRSASTGHRYASQSGINGRGCLPILKHWTLSITLECGGFRDDRRCYPPAPPDADRGPLGVQRTLSQLTVLNASHDRETPK